MESTADQQIATDFIAKAEEILKTTLLNQEYGGAVSVQAFITQLRQAQIPESAIHSVVSHLKQRAGTQDNGDKSAPWFYYPRSFYTKSAFDSFIEEQEKSAEGSADNIPAETSGERDEQERTNRQDEARLCSYVSQMLTELYDSNYTPDNIAEWVFDVHNLRPGTKYRNVDILAVDWQSETVVELVAIEAKLNFSAESIQQATFYQQFANRVWVAAVVDGTPDRAGSVLRSQDPLLFDHAVNMGLGILACSRGQGRSFRIAAIQWPKKQNPSPLQTERFLEAYREQFEVAGVIETSKRRPVPKVG